LATVTVSVSEFQENLTHYLESDVRVAITEGGRKLGVFIPLPRPRTDVELAAFDNAAAKWQSELDAAGITEDEAVRVGVPTWNTRNVEIYLGDAAL